MNLNRWIYRQLITIGIPDSIQLYANHNENEKSTIANVRPIRTLLNVLKRTNVIMFPYGRAYRSGEQHFEETESFYDDAFIQFCIASGSAFERWRRGIKPGAFWLAQRTGCKIVPVYIDAFDGRWRLSLGQFIGVKSGSSPAERKHRMLQGAKSYVAEMKKLRATVQPILRSW
jgi:1-acyl-sn-glycerol-3-phosphate acyltransferase